MHTDRWFASARSQRLTAYAVIAFSAALALNDFSPRLDLQLELASRFCMLAVAGFAVRATAGDRCARLLVWGLIGVSLDLFWQTNTDAGPEQWTAMVVKYAGVSGGLTALLLLTARFGNAANRTRERIANAAPWLGLALLAAGLLHGALWITQCQTACAPADRPLDALALASYDLYLLLDALIRVLMIGLALAGLVRADPNERQRLLLVASACMLFAAGTVVDFAARLLPLDALLPPDWRHNLDALATFAFPILLWAAILKRQLFDVEYVLSRALVYSAVIALLGLAFVLTEQVLHFLFSQWSYKKVLVNFFGRETAEHLNLEMIADVAVGIGLTFLFKPLEERAAERISHAFSPDREKRVELLESFAERLPLIADGTALERRLVRTLERGTNAAFTGVYLRDAKGNYVVTPSSAAVAPVIGAAAIGELSRGKPIAGARARALVAAAEIILPMLVGGKLFGVIVCGPKRSEVSYAPDEIKCLARIAREAGSCLFALRLAA